MSAESVQPEERPVSGGTFRFELATPESLAEDGDFAFVIVPGVEGDFGVLPGHAPLVSSLRPGVVRAWRRRDGAERVWFVPGGFAEAGARRLTLLVHAAEPLEGLRSEDLRQSLEDAREDLEDAKGEDEAAEAKRAAIRRRIAVAAARLAASERFGGAASG